MTDDQWIELAEKARDGFHGRPIPHSLRVSDPVYMEAWIRVVQTIAKELPKVQKVTGVASDSVE